MLRRVRPARQPGSVPTCFLQAVTLIVWTAARYFLYASYFTIFGVLFGFKNFGKMVAIDNTFNGLIGAHSGHPADMYLYNCCCMPPATAPCTLISNARHTWHMP